MVAVTQYLGTLADENLGPEVTEGATALERFKCRALRMKNHRRFDYFIGILISCNAGSIGAQSDYSVRNETDDIPGVFRVIELFFVVAFSMELTLRLFTEGCSFFSFRNECIKWNLFDFVVVFSAISEEIAMIVLGGEAPNSSVIGLVRLLRLVRVIRVLRVMRFFRDLRVMVAGIATSIKSLVWALILLMLIMYIFGMFFMQVVAEAILAGSPDRVLLLEYYGSMEKTIYTLYGSICGGIDWSDAATPLMDISWFNGVLFMSYIAVSVFCVLNIVTGVFVENANAMTSKDEDHMIMERLTERKQWMEDMKSLFSAAGGGKIEEGELDIHHFEASFSDVRVRTYLNKLGIDVESDTAIGIFAMFDADGSGAVSLEEFANGIQQIQGNARAIEVCRLQHITKKIASQLDSLEALMDQRSDKTAVSEGEQSVKEDPCFPQ